MLTQLANSGDSFVDAFHVFLTYPFVDEVVGRDPQVARNLHMGDYTNLSIDLDLNLNKIPGVCFPLDAIPPLGELPPLGALCQDVQDAVQECIDDLNTNFGVQQCLAGPARRPDRHHRQGAVQADPGGVPQRPAARRAQQRLDDLLGGLTGGLLKQRRRRPGQRQRRRRPRRPAGGLTDNLGLGRAPFGELPAADRGRAYGR